MTASNGSAAESRENTDRELTAELRAELLNPEAWRELLTAYARTSELALGMIDADGKLLGQCYNPQPLWELIRKARSDSIGTCPFCLSPATPCSSLNKALESGKVTLAQDGIGLAHVTAPLLLEGKPVGALIAGQVLNGYPDSVRLDRVASEFGIPPDRLWDLAIQQAPFNRAKLLLHGELIMGFGQVFLRQRYDAMAERKLAEQSCLIRSLMDSVSECAIYTEDGDRKVTSWSAGAERLFGFTEAEAIGREAPRLFTSEEIQNSAPQEELRTAEREGVARSEYWQIRKDGTRFLARSILAKLTVGNNLEFGRITYDITEQRRRQEEAIQAKKVQSIGALAEGIAHDFNNLMASVLVNAGSLLEDLDAGDPKRKRLEEIVAAGEEAEGLANRLLAFSGKGFPIARARVDLSGIVAKTVELAKTVVPDRVTLETRLASDLPPIEADDSLLQQVVMSLVMNASESIGLETGVVKVSTGSAAPDVYLEVKDSGCGMDEATRARIFEPFFTTKFLGRGLGLAAASGIVGAHHGRTEVESAVGKGTTFRIYLPAASNHS